MEVTIKTWKGFMIIVAVLVVIFGLPALWFRYENQQTEKVFRNVTQPGWQQIGDEKFGNRFCQDACPGESRIYSAPQITKDNAIPIFKDIVQKSGFTMDREDILCTTTPKVSYSSSLCSVSGKKSGLYLGISLDINKSNPSITSVGVDFGHHSYFFGLFHH